MSSVDSDMTLRFTSDNRVTKLGVKIRIDYILDGNFCKIKKMCWKYFVILNTFQNIIIVIDYKLLCRVCLFEK